MNVGFSSRLGSAGLLAGVVVALLAGSSGVAAAEKDLGGGCTYYEASEKGYPTKCPGWHAGGEDLSNLNLRGAVFTNATFDSSKLIGTNFTNADLRGVKSIGKMSGGTRFDGAKLDNETFFGHLVDDQRVTANVSSGNKTYFALEGFKPRAIAQGVTIDGCTSDKAATVDGKRVLLPGSYGLRCAVTAEGGQGKGTTTFPVRVDGKTRNLRPGEVG